jgi:hypothetical protein
MASFRATVSVYKIVLKDGQIFYNAESIFPDNKEVVRKGAIFSITDNIEDTTQLPLIFAKVRKKCQQMGIFDHVSGLQ